MAKLLDDVRHPELERSDAPGVVAGEPVGDMIAKGAWLIASTIPPQMQAAIRSQALQKEVETGRNMRSVHIGQADEELGNVALCDNVVTCQPTETVDAGKRPANCRLSVAGKLLNRILSYLFKLLAGQGLLCGITILLEVKTFGQSASWP